MRVEEGGQATTLSSSFYEPTGCEVEQNHNAGVLCKQRHDNIEQAPRMSLPLDDILNDLHRAGYY